MDDAGNDKIIIAITDTTHSVLKLFDYQTNTLGLNDSQTAAFIAAALGGVVNIIDRANPAAAQAVREIVGKS